MSNEESKVIIEALEKADKYRWHDLRKNPDDLPTDMPVYVYYDCGHKGHELAVGAWWDIVGDTIENVIAWKYIEPFEEVEE